MPDISLAWNIEGTGSIRLAVLPTFLRENDFCHMRSLFHEMKIARVNKNIKTNDQPDLSHAPQISANGGIICVSVHPIIISLKIHWSCFPSNLLTIGFHPQNQRIGHKI